MTLTVDTTTEPVNLIWNQGDTQGQTFRFLADTDTPYDLTEFAIQATARNTLGQIQKLTVWIPTPTDGVLTIQPPASGLEPDVYDYDIQFTSDQGVATWIHGRIRVRRDVSV